MTTPDGSRPDPLGLPDPDLSLGEGPVIDPRDPLGLGDLPVEDPDRDEDQAADEDQADSPVAATGEDQVAGAAEESSSDQGAAEQDPSPDARAGDLPDAAADVDAAATDRSDTVPAGPTVVDDVPEAASSEGADAPAPAGDESIGEPAEEPAHRADEAADGDLLTPVPSRGPVRPPRSGWARLGHAMRPRTTQGQLITAGLCALLGFALVVQVRQATDTQLGALRQNDLVRLLDETTTRTDELEQESLDLQRERDELLSGSDRQQAALDAARRTAAMQGILTGRLPATGPGVRITLTEPDGEIRPATMLHVLEELRNAGAEAMELNGHRITASSAFTGTRGAIELDGVAIESPFRWTVIGDPDTIAPALEIPGGALARVRADLGRGTVEKSDRVDVTATRVPSDPVHASPVADED